MALKFLKALIQMFSLVPIFSASCSWLKCTKIKIKRTQNCTMLQICHHIATKHCLEGFRKLFAVENCTSVCTTNSEV
uniref:Secreted peptide n=1 Tax=Rhipicephalus pulchellus TaxID=72859 RepID=L7LU85_RHIPC